MTQIFPETRMIRLSDDEEIMMLAFFVLIQCRSVTDGQTDGRTFLLWLYQRMHSYCYANALVKIHAPGRKISYALYLPQLRQTEIHLADICRDSPVMIP